MTTAPSTVTSLLDHLTATGGRPALTWYGDAGERIELSGAVLGNWVAKTVNLLVEEFDAGPGTDVVVDLPVGWRQTVWALAAARCGATLTLHDPGSGPADLDTPSADVVVTSRPDTWSGTSAELVAVALPALARRFDGDLPPGVIDAAAAVMTYGDAIGLDPVAGRSPSLAALPGARDGEGAATEPAGRTLVRGDRPVAAVLGEIVEVWVGGGSVVLTSDATARELAADAARLERLVATEQIARS
ncbi:TIGR03089 family protein [Isoptericola croceus]|uniref:TIGR03089 family protein n=1 Tax=Isoptericola croceus TaxID=3031406 RepID=UPI0023F8F44C|nr:TIGR03089 family protein [Isoptericola croceus]